MATLSKERWSVRRRAIGPGAALVALLVSALALFAFTNQQDQVNKLPVPTRWQGNAVTWNLNPTVGSNVSTTGGPSVQQALANSFNTWATAQMNLGGQNRPVVRLSITLGHVPSSLPAAPDSSDCLNVVSFTDPIKSDFPTGTIAFTAISTVTPPPTTYSCTSPPTMRVCNLNSCLVDADIEFNPTENFSTSNLPLSGKFDLQSTATHEIGHLLGLDHSGIFHAVMFPFGDTSSAGVARTLSVDDEAGIASIYPASNFSALTGIISGKITQSGAGIFGAHVVAVDAASGSAVVDGLTNPDGTYNLAGIPPGSYNVLVLPLAGTYTVTDFSGWSCGYSPSCKGVPNPTNYTGKFF